MTQETFKQRQARGLREARTEIVPNVISPDQEFAARHAADPMRESRTPVEDEHQGMTSGGTVTHVRPGTVTMYKPTPNGYSPRQVPANRIGVNLMEGWRSVCPQCNGHHGSDPNACAGREPIAYRICPVCPPNANGEPHKVYDNRVSGFSEEAVDHDDPNFIQDDAYAASTPAIRTKAALDWHIWNRHPQEAREMGLAAIAEQPSQRVPELLAEPFRDLAPPPSEPAGR